MTTLISIGIVDQFLPKGTYAIDRVQRDLGPLLDEILYMPIIFLYKDSPNELVDEYLAHVSCPVIE